MSEPPAPQPSVPETSAPQATAPQATAPLKSGARTPDLQRPRRQVEPSQYFSHPVGVLHEVRWQEICPWLILVKALRVTLLIRVMVIAWIGVALTNWGWVEMDRAFSLDQATEILPAIDPQPLNSRALNPTVAAPGASHLEVIHSGPLGRLSAAPVNWIDPLIQPRSPFLRGWYWLSESFVRLVDRELSWRGSLGLALHGLWALVVWAMFGSAICRIAALYLTRGETLGPVVALRDAVTIWPGVAGAPFIPLLTAVAMAVPLMLLGLLLRFNQAAVAAGLLWLVVLAWALMLVVLLLGLLLGWPLMWACLAVERSDAFDGVSRCYAYVYQKPLKLAFYVVVAALLAFLGEGVVTYFVAATVTLSEWAVSCGAGSVRAGELFDAPWQSSPVNLATRWINGWRQGLDSLAAAYPLACLWPFSLGIYLLLRSDIDATEIDEFER